MKTIVVTNSPLEGCHRSGVSLSSYVTRCLKSFSGSFSVKAAAFFAVLAMSVGSSDVSYAQPVLVPPGGQSFSLSCPTGPAVQFSLDNNSGEAVVSVTGINAGGNVNVTTSYGEQARQT